MTTMQVKLKQSFIKGILLLSLFVFCLCIMGYLLHGVLFYMALFLWLLALVVLLLNYVFAARVAQISLIETEHIRKVNLQYGDIWYNEVQVCRSILIGGALYLEFKLAKRKKLKLWLFRDNFANFEERYQLIRFLVLAV